MNDANGDEQHESIDQMAVKSDTGLLSSKENIPAAVNTTMSSDEQTVDVLLAPLAQTQLATTDTLYDKREIVAEWRVPLRGKLHKLEFEHGTTSGRRVLWIDEKVNRTILFVRMPIALIFARNFMIFVGIFPSRVDV